MADVLFILFGLAFFVVALGYVVGCDRLAGGVR